MSKNTKQVQKDSLKKIVKLQEEESKNQQKYLIIIPIIVIILLIFLGGLVFGLYKFLNFKKPIKKDWGQTYYLYLKDIKNQPDKKEQVFNDNAKIKFIETKEIDKPVMIINYESKENNYTNVYYIQNEKVNTIINQEPTSVELLYDIKGNEYNYYFHIEKDNLDYYQSLTEQLKNESTDEQVELTPSYSFDKNKTESTTDENGNQIVVSEFDKNFVKVDINEKELDFKESMSDNELKETVENSISNYKPQEEKLTEEIKSATKEKVEEINTNLELITKNSIENIFENLKGVWITNDKEFSLEINYKNNKKYLNFGWFGSEAYILGNIKEINYLKDNKYSFIIADQASDQNQEIDIDLTDIKNKKIKVNNYYTMKYVAKNMDAAYQSILN